MATEPQFGSAPQVLYEKTDANVHVLAWSGIGMFAAIALIVLGMWWLFNHFNRVQSLGATPAPYPTVRALPPEPRLQANPRGDYDEYIRLQRQQLSGYGWINREAGVVRIPVSLAMQLVVSRGLPVAPANAQEALSKPGSTNGTAPSPKQPNPERPVRSTP